MPIPEHVTELLRQSSRHDAVYEAILDAIGAGTLASGELLRESEIGEWLGVSREPIRQALRRLQDVGLVDLRPGRTPRVSEFDVEHTNRAMMLSTVLNEYGVRRSIGRLTLEQCRRLEQRRIAVHNARDAGAIDQLAHAIGDFFSFFPDLTGNVVVAELIDRVDAELARFLLPGSESANIQIDGVIRDMDDLADAAYAGDQQRAIDILARIYTPTYHNFFTRFRRPS